MEKNFSVHLPFAIDLPWVGKMPWRRERLLTPVFWPGEFHGLYCSWDRNESDLTEGLSLSLSHIEKHYNH